MCWHEVPTALHLINNGISVNTPGRNLSSLPHIFRNGPQVLKMPSRSGLALMAQVPTAAASSESTRRKEYERVFGQGQGQFQETTNAELSRPQISTVRQLQRALQNKILQSSRPAGLSVVFHKMATNQVMGDEHTSPQAAVDFCDLRRAIDGFNLPATDELVRQLLSTFDADNDGLLSMAEFVAGLQADNKGMFQLNQPECGLSSRRYFKTIKFHHPLHNMTYMSPVHNFEQL